MSTDCTTTPTQGIRARALTAIAGGALALTGLGAAMPVADAAPAPAPVAAVSTANTAPTYVPINQFTTGLPTQAVDCGPAAAVSAMLAEGHTPTAWDAANPSGAVAAVRADIGHSSATMDTDVEAAIDAQGVHASTDTDFTGSLDAVRGGKSAVLNGYVDALPYAYSSGNPHVAHWILVTDYDKDTKTFTVLDSNDGSKRSGITQAQLEVFQASVGAGQQQVVVG